MTAPPHFIVSLASNMLGAAFVYAEQIKNDDHEMYNRTRVQRYAMFF